MLTFRYVFVDFFRLQESRALVLSSEIHFRTAVAKRKRGQRFQIKATTTRKTRKGLLN